MIKINLLGSAPPPSKSSQGGPPAPKATQILMFVGAMILAFGIVGVVYEVWSHEISDKQAKLAQEKLRQTELAAVEAQNAQYQQHLRDLETRIDTIQALQNSRVGPVQLMSALGNVVNKTSDVYLYTLMPAEEGFQLKGQTSSVNSMANLLSYLKSSGAFDDVSLNQFYQDNTNERLTYKFTVSCRFKSPTGGPSPTSGAMPEGPHGAAPATAQGPGAPASGPQPPQAAPPQGSGKKIM